ncbi:hypothetical protein C8E87_3214 [Paractinoplanes brasiliensis]|uniref:Uncharacterized protein n=1 Tax=Paractinoplanes brasiliensis TaxID=52695 RepID=A0A4R6JS72_9ACTN|nr:hypothetical protein C8E87_3214 [Actinoplanes brasiliensis]
MLLTTGLGVSAEFVDPGAELLQLLTHRNEQESAGIVDGRIGDHVGEFVVPCLRFLQLRNESGQLLLGWERTKLSPEVFM